MDDYYKVLELNKNASIVEIRKSFRALALKYHPDKNKNVGSKEKFMKVVEAYEVLSDSNGKKNYDESITIKKNTPIWDIGEKASKAMWKATIILLASLATMALLILFLP